jgi:hypothetical protein
MSENFLHTSIKDKEEILENSKFFTTKIDCDFFDEENNPRLNKEEDKKVLAKLKYRQDNTYKYLIKIDNNKKLFNPKTDLSDNKRNNLSNQYFSQSSSFKEVSKKAFDYYLTFLRTSNILWLNSAQREDF